MFDNLLKSLSELDRPESARLQFCFVENNACLTINESVKRFTQSTERSAIALCDPRVGIPFARNKALEWSLNSNADFLAFVDDDEIVNKSWLVELFSEIEDRGLDLVGGPVFPMVSDQKLNWSEALVLRGLKLRAKRIADRNNRLTQSNGDGDITIVTNNWMCRLDFLRSKNIQFDESLCFSGGSDVALFRSVKQAGCKSGWAPKAIVAEELPRSRLTFSYQFVRGRDQAVSSYRIRYTDTLSVWRILTSLLFVISKVVLGLLRTFASLFDKGASITLALRAFGFAWGRVLAMAGHRSKHYQRVHGS